MPRKEYREKNYPHEIQGVGGIYCFYPWDVIDSQHSGVFKIGKSEKFPQRIDNYHTALPGGVFFKAFLVNPTKGKFNFESKAQYLSRVEKHIYDYVKKGGGEPVNMEIRKRDEGQTEWIYCKSRAIDKAFGNAAGKFGGELMLYSLQMPSEQDRDRYDNLFKGVVYFER